MAQRPTITARFEGPAATAGVPLDDLLGVLEHFQLAVRRVVEDLAGRRPTAGRLPETIRSAGSLVFRRTRRGSLIAELELAEPSGEELPDLGLDAIERLLEGIDEPHQLPEWAAREVGLMRIAMHEGIDRVTFSSGTSKRRAVLDRAVVAVPVPEVIASQVPQRVTGRILEVDWKDHTAELHTPGGVVRLVFADELGDEFRRLARRQVTAEGPVEYGIDGSVRRVLVETVTPALDDQSFWEPLSIAALAEAQGVHPFAFEEHSGEPRESADDLLKAIFG